MGHHIDAGGDPDVVAIDCSAEREDRIHVETVD